MIKYYIIGAILVLLYVAWSTPDIIIYEIEKDEVISAEVISAEVTAYSELDSCHHKGCPMASTKKAYVGAAACPRSIPLGSTIVIKSIGTFICEDRLAKRFDHRFDIFTGYGKIAWQEAVAFGVKVLEVRVVYAEENEM